jgi:ribosomal protein L12E/L44/L45/RPP1/RPP2
MSAIIPIISKFNDAGIKKAQSSFKSLNRTLGAVGVGLGLTQIASFAKNAVKGFEKAQIASSKLANVMQSMGVGMATARVDAYAESLQGLFAVDADVIKATQTKLATFAELNKTINVTGGAFDRATVAALDLAAAGFGTAEGNAVQLGKALNDPIKGLTSLTKSGVTFTTQEKAKIKQLVATNKTLEAQDLILKAIEKQVGGTAAAGASVFDRLQLSIDSVSDSVGEILLPYIKEFTNFLISEVIPNVQSFLKDLSNPETEAGKTFLEIKGAVESSYNAVKDFFALFGDGDAMKGFGNVVTELVKALPALLALKGIMMLASGGKAIASLAKAIGLMTGAGAAGAVGDGGTIVGGGGKKGKGAKGKSPLSLGKAGVIGAIAGTVLSIPGSTAQTTQEDIDQREAYLADVERKKKLPGYGTGVNLVPGGGKVTPPTPAPKFKVPGLATGGIVMPSPGGSLVNVAEAGQAEAIIPLDKMATMGIGGGGTFNITVNAGVGANGAQIGTEIVNAIKAYERSNGKGWRA